MSAEGIVNNIIDCKADARILDASSCAAPLANIMQTGDCMDEALREQAKDASQPKLILNAEGIVNKTIDCKADAETFEASSGAVPPTSTMHPGDCMDQALRDQVKDPIQLKLILTPRAS